MADSMDKVSARVLGPEQGVSDALGDILKTGLLFGAGGAVASAVINLVKKKAGERRRRKLLESFVESDSPVVRADPDIGDTDIEEAMMHVGTDEPGQLAKVSSAQEAIDRLTDRQPYRGEPGTGTKIITAPGRLGLEIIGDVAREGAAMTPLAPAADFLSDTAKRPWVPAAQVAAALAAVYGGYRGMDWLMDKIEADEAESEYARKKNLYQSRVAEALTRKYAPEEKTASLLRLAGEMNGNVFAGTGDGQQKSAARERSESGQFLGALGILGALGLGGLSYAAAKRHFDKKSEARQRYKQLEREVRQKYLYEQVPLAIEADLGFLGGPTSDEKSGDREKRRKAEAVRTTLRSPAIAGEVAGLVEEPVESLQQEALKAKAKDEDTTPVLA